MLKIENDLIGQKKYLKLDNLHSLKISNLHVKFPY